MNMDKARNFEKTVADYISINKNYKIIHDGNNPKKSDVKLDYKGNQTYIEVKLSTQAQFGSPRLKYENNTWTGIADNEITTTMSKVLNESDRPKQIIDVIKNESNYSNDMWLGYSVSHYKHKREGVEITTNGKSTLDMPSFNTVYKSLISNFGNQILLERFYCSGMIDNIMSYYKNKGALFAQVGDSFYKTSDDFDCSLYGFKQEIPKWKCTMFCEARFTFRKTKQWIEILPTLKPVDMVDSPYSLNPNSSKNSPYIS